MSWQHEGQSRSGGQIALHIHGFTTKYVTNEDGATREVDYVHVAQRGQEQWNTIPIPVRNIFEIEPLDPNNPVTVMAHQRKALVKEAYDNWKGGKGDVVNGTPLGAWPGINQAQAEIIRHAGLHSVEDLAAATENQIMRIRLPDARDYRDRARRFLAAKPQAAEAGKLGKLEADNERMRAELDEMRAMMRAMQKAQAPPEAAVVDEEDDELEAVRELARERGLARVGKKSKATLIAELEALEAGQPVEAVA